MHMNIIIMQARILYAYAEVWYKHTMHCNIELDGAFIK